MGTIINLAKWQQKDLRERAAKGYGEFVTVDWKETVREGTPAAEEVVVLDPDTGESESFYFLDHRERMYVGKMNAGQTGQIIAILGAVFVNGSNLQQAEGRTDGIAFAQFLDQHHLELLVATILEVEIEWVNANFDLDGWVMDVVAVFFKYNNFFAVLNKLMESLNKMGLTSDTVVTAMAGRPATRNA